MENSLRSLEARGRPLGTERSTSVSGHTAATDALFESRVERALENPERMSREARTARRSEGSEEDARRDQRTERDEARANASSRREEQAARQAQREDRAQGVHPEEDELQRLIDGFDGAADATGADRPLQEAAESRTPAVDPTADPDAGEPVLPNGSPEALQGSAAFPDALAPDATGVSVSDASVSEGEHPGDPATPNSGRPGTDAGTAQAEGATRLGFEHGALAQKLSRSGGEPNTGASTGTGASPGAALEGALPLDAGESADLSGFGDLDPELGSNAEPSGDLAAAADGEAPEARARGGAQADLTAEPKLERAVTQLDRAVPQRVDAARSNPTAATGSPNAPARPERPLSPEQAAQVLKQVRIGISGANGVREATINLQPAWLGRVSIRIAVREGRALAEVRAERPEALQALEKHLPELRAALAERGFEQAEFDLGLSDQDADRRGGDQAFGPRGPRVGRTAVIAAPAELTHPDAPAAGSETNSDLGVDTYA